MKIIDNQSLVYSYLETNQLHEYFSRVDVNKIKLCRFDKGEMMITAGEPLQEMLFLVEGKVKIFTVTAEDKRLIIRFLKAFAMLGDIEFANEENAITSVEAITDCLVLSIPYNYLKETIGKNPSFLYFLLQSISHKFRTKTNFTTFNVLYPVEVRFASYLLSISTDSKGTVFREEMKHSSLADIADMIGTSYRHLNRVIQKLCNEQVIERAKGSIHIKNLQKLRDLAKDNIYE
ncbi:Crp/Fnr family transcriptional regulator [Bacillus testis]|uniref:Crp/Fnr family transcriptional regulator n=1 Tax=Bacillus testis TaxID=1622072 RepID=UPI00067E7785|nr:Crp/Fnr family transcriptional regulator [Bacillus testis]